MYWALLGNSVSNPKFRVGSLLTPKTIIDVVAYHYPGSKRELGHKYNYSQHQLARGFTCKIKMLFVALCCKRWTIWY